MSDSKTVKSGANSEAALKDLRSVMQGMTMPYSDADMRRLGLELLNFVLAGSQHSRISSLGADAGADGAPASHYANACGCDDMECCGDEALVDMELDDRYQDYASCFGSEATVSPYDCLHSQLLEDIDRVIAFFFDYYGLAHEGRSAGAKTTAFGYHALDVILYISYLQNRNAAVNLESLPVNWAETLPVNLSTTWLLDEFEDQPREDYQQMPSLELDRRMDRMDLLRNLSDEDRALPLREYIHEQIVEDFKILARLCIERCVSLRDAMY